MKILTYPQHTEFKQKSGGSLVVWCVALLFFVFSLSLSAKTAHTAKQLNFRTYTLFDGLPQGQVTTLAIDNDGFLWTGSYAGVTRYDGREFKTFSDPLPNMNINVMEKEKNGRILIGTGAGFCRLTNSQFDCLKLGERLPFHNIYSIAINGENDYWLGADGGLIRFTPSRSYSYTEDDGLPSESVRSLVKDQTGRLWIGTDAGLAYIDKPEEFASSAHNEGAASDSASTPEKKQLIHEFLPSLLGERSIRGLLVNAQGLWIAASGGLYLLDLNTMKVESVHPKVFEKENLLSLFEDSLHQLWIGSYRGVYRLKDNHLDRLAPQKGLESKGIYIIRENKDGVLWMGSDAGLVKYVPGAFEGYTVRNGLVHDFIRAIDIADDGNVWMGTREGVSILDPNTDELINIHKALGPGLWRIYSLVTISPTEALLGSQQGLVHWKAGKIQKVYRDESADDALPASYVGAMFKDGNKIWIGTRRGIALWEDGQLKKLPQSNLHFGGIFALQMDRLGRLWIGSGSLGIVLYDPKKKKYLRVPSNSAASDITVWDIARDNSGVMWVGTNGHGLVKMDEKLQDLAVFDAARQLKDSFVWQVLSDSRNNVWAYTNTGLKRFNGEYFYHYDAGDGLLDLEGTATAVAEHANGEIWFGTAYGVMRYNPTLDEPPKEPPPILIEGAWQGLKPITQSHHTNFGEGAITIKFASLSFRDERDTRFSYRLLGADSRWSAPIRDNHVQFASLSAGQYSFEVKAINGHHMISEQPARFKFSVDKPYWQAIWFYALIALSIALVIYTGLRLRLRKLAADKAMLESMVLERTQTIERVNQELQRLVVTDELTQLHNRRYLMGSVDRALTRLQRAPHSASLSFILFDVDFFKKVNDVYGHVAGDEVLREIATRLTRTIRKTDLAARYGGEEFAILLPFTDTEGALNIGEKFRKLVASQPVKCANGEAIKVTVSLGIATVFQQQLSHKNLSTSEFIGQADKALYWAKEHGRNQSRAFCQLPHDG